MDGPHSSDQTKENSTAAEVESQATHGDASRSISNHIQRMRHVLFSARGIFVEANEVLERM